MKFWTWFRRTSEPAASCATCARALVVCPDCQGAWQDRPCHCGLGHLCPVHGRYHL